MNIQLTKEVVEALIKAKCKSPALIEDEVRWSGVSIDTKFILPEDVPIIRTVLKKPEFWDHIENRRVIRKLDAVAALQQSGVKQTKIKRLEVLAEAIRNVIEETPNKWVFTASAHGTLLPYFVTNVEYHPPQTNHNGRATPAYVSLELGATARHVDVGHDIHFQREALPGTVEEILASKDIFIETEKLVSEYTADMEKYQKEAPKTGEQYLARGVGIPATEGRSSSRIRWHSDTIHFEKEGRAAKTVMDDESDQGDATGYSNTKFWFAKHTSKDDEEGEEAFKLPAHPIVRVFDLGRHEFFDTHIGSVDLYKYDAAASDKLVLPDEHKELVDALTGSVIEKMDDIITGKAGGIIVIASGAPGTGKCLGRGTPVLLADGRILPVEEIQRGDRLMGPDGKARGVLSTNRGCGPLFRIDPIRGEPFVCNDAHMMTLVKSGTDRVIDIPLVEYLKLPNRSRYKLFSASVHEFEGSKTSLPVDPYFLGVWFGDGEKTLRKSGQLRTVSVAKPDLEIKQVCTAVAAQWGLKVRDGEGGSGCPSYYLSGENFSGKSNDLLDALRDLVGGQVEVPRSYMTASWDDRMAFLAGFLDADAELSCNCFIITQKRKDWSEAIAFVARSLGFKIALNSRTAKDQNGTEGVYWVVTISGDTHSIPTRIPRKRAAPRQQIKVATRTGFSVSPLGNGEYFGFTLTGDGRFLLGDFTVTHNTLTAEVYSEAAKRPLYMVQCSQLGTNEEVLEKKLALVLERAVRWRTILLIDEADVYIHERGKDIQQNAIVGVFLRLLEYYNGIMFMTTNRATVIDDAIMSRATAHIKYEIPTDDAKRTRLWKVLAAQYGVEGLDIFKAIQTFPKVSGRSIRQLIRLAKIMANRNGTKVTVASLKWAAKFHDFSEAEEAKL